MRLIKAELVTIRKKRVCAVCEVAMEKCSVVWREVWDDDDQITTGYIHLQCEGEEETREEQRESLVTSLANDPG